MSFLPVTFLYEIPNFLHVRHTSHQERGACWEAPLSSPPPGSAKQTRQLQLCSHRHARLCRHGRRGASAPTSAVLLSILESCINAPNYRQAPRIFRRGVCANGLPARPIDRSQGARTKPPLDFLLQPRPEAAAAARALSLTVTDRLWSSHTPDRRDSPLLQNGQQHWRFLFLLCNAQSGENATWAPIKVTVVSGCQPASQSYNLL